MKKYNLFKVIAITVFVAWLLTLIIPGSYVDYSGNVTTNAVAGVGIWGLLSNLSISISYFNGIALLLIAVSCFYAILNKVDIYNTFVNKTSSIFKGKEKLLVIITSLVFGIFSLFVSEFLILLVFIPFIYKVMKELKIDDKVILSSTLVAGLIGCMCSIYNSTLFQAFSLSINTLLLVKVLLFVISMFVLIFLIAPKKSNKENNKKINSKSNKKNSTKEELKEKVVKKVIAKEDKKVKKIVYAILTLLFGSIGINKFYAGKIREGILCLLFSWTLIPLILSIVEFITVLTIKKDKNGLISVSSNRIKNVLFATLLVIFTLFVVGSVIPFESLFKNVSVFTDFNTWLSKLSIGNYKIFNNIIGMPVTIDATYGSKTGTINAFGSFTMNDISILLFILTMIVAIKNKFKVNDFIATVTDGIKKILPIAITAMLISIVLIMMVTTGVNVTITNLILKITKGFNIATSMLASILGSLLTSDFYYYISSIATVFTVNVTNKDYYGVIAFIMQSIYNVMMIIAPTSVGLIIGLYYLNIPYNKWLKFIWKLLLILLVIVIITAIIIYVLV